MPNFAKIPLAVLFVLTAFGCDSNSVELPEPSTQPTVTPKGPDLQGPKVSTGSDAPIANQRTQAGGSAGNSHSDAPQGVKGRVLQPDGSPAVGVSVMLLENAMANPIDLFLMTKTGQVSPPLSTAETVADGSFALGILKAGQAVDLRVISDQYPELSKSPIKVRSEDWYDAGDLKLALGLVVKGRVVDSKSKAAIADVTVYMNASNRSHTMSATPGRERGIATKTNNNGIFRFANAPILGAINLSAEIDGYASSNLLNKRISADTPNDFTIEIERGRTITGVVVDGNGQRISQAKILAYGLSAKTPQNETVYTDQDGEFHFPPLRSGPYRLTCSANRFADVEVPLALTDEDVKIVLRKRGSLKLRVLSTKNRPLKSYRLSLKRSFPNNPVNIGNVFDFPDRNITPSNHEGQWAIIEGLPSGTFKVQLSERNHAKTLSEMFTIQEASDAVEVTVVLTTGGVITGKVIDNNGKPVAGATVTSDMNAGLAAQTGFLEVFGNLIPKKHTARSVKTNKQGRFRINSLSFADYMLRISHQRYCEGTAINIQITEEGQVVDAGVIQLELGTVVTGTTMIDGVAAGQVKVTISRPTVGNPAPQSAKGPPTTAEMQAAARQLFNTKALSDGDGHFTMLKRVPPGTYKITAARQSASSPFITLLDMKKSEQTLVIAPGQDRAVVNFNLSGQ